MPVNPYQKYQQQSVMTMTQGEMLTKLYNEIIKQFSGAAMYMREPEPNITEINRALQKGTGQPQKRPQTDRGGHSSGHRTAGRFHSGGPQCEKTLMFLAILPEFSGGMLFCIAAQHAACFTGMPLAAHLLKKVRYCTAVHPPPSSGGIRGCKSALSMSACLGARGSLRGVAP